MSAVAVAILETGSCGVQPNVCTLLQAKAIASAVINARAPWQDFYGALHGLSAMDRQKLRASMWPGEFARG
jgi:hypothetical protein